MLDFDQEPMVMMQQGNGGGSESTDVTAKERILANNARAYQAIDNQFGNPASDRGRNSGFASWSRTADRITAQAEKNRQVGAKSALTRAQNNMDKAMTSDATFADRAKAGKSLQKAKEKNLPTLSKPVSAADLVDPVAAKKAQRSAKAKATRQAKAKAKAKATAK